MRFAESAKDHKDELSQMLFPLFVHFYLDMIQKDLTDLGITKKNLLFLFYLFTSLSRFFFVHNKTARQFFDKFASVQAPQHAVDVRQLKSVANKEQLSRSGIRDAYIGTKFNVKLADESYRMLKDFVKLKNSKQLVELIKENMMLEIYTGPLRTWPQQASETPFQNKYKVTLFV